MAFLVSFDTTQLYDLALIFFISLYWHVVDLQYDVSFRCTAGVQQVYGKVNQLYIYIYISPLFIFDSFSYRSLQSIE